MGKRSHGDGGIDTRGENVHRLRYRLNGKRFTKTIHGSLTDARKELGRLIQSGHVGEHIAPDKVTVAQWIDRWMTLNQRNEGDVDGTRRRGLVNRRTLERYEELLRCHVTPTLGKRPLQKLHGTEIDDLYVALEKKLSPRTVHHIHTVFGACLKAAVRKGLITNSPVARAEAPSPGESDHGMALDEDQLRTLLEGFRPSVLFPIVAVLAFTGARRGEVLALRWSDLDVEKKTLRIERAVEQTAKYELAIKEPKTKRGKRAITIDDDLIALLVAEREKLQRIHAGVPDGAKVNLSLVKLPDDALTRNSCAGPVCSAFRNFACTISAERTKPCCSTPACPCTSLRRAVAMIRRCYCEATRSIARRPTPALQRSSERCRRASCEAEKAPWVQVGSKVAKSCQGVHVPIPLTR
jgi:integrase